MGLSSKVVSNNEGFAFEYNWTTPPPPPTSPKQPPAKPSPAKRRHPSSQNESEPLNCPRCDSTNTKFCYYNNYNKSQPRHYCKSCKRHWTKGGTLRNVPIGGGRKNKRQKTTTAAAAAHSDGPVFLGPSWAADAQSNNSHGDIMSNVQFPLSSPSSFYGWLGGKATEDSIITTAEPTATGGGFAGDLEAPVASLWSWDDIETLISTNTPGSEINAQF